MEAGERVAGETAFQAAMESPERENVQREPAGVFASACRLMAYEHEEIQKRVMMTGRLCPTSPIAYLIGFGSKCPKKFRRP